MAASILYNPREQYTLDSGALCAGGTLYFYAPESTTPKNVYSDVDLGVSLGATVELDSAGRTPTDVFLSGAYNVELKDADDAQVWLAENVGADTGGLTPLDPADGDDGQVYSTDGTTAEWRDIEEVPDPGGHSGKYLGTDGTVVQWTAFPTATEYTDDDLPASFTQTNTSSGGFTFGNIRVQWGSDTAPIAAAIVSTKAVTFGVAFSGTPYTVQVTPTAGGVTSDTPSARCSAQALSANTTGFTASMFAGAEDEGSGSTNITSTVAFTWLAIGPK